jgi:glutamate N-acetyltransferase/amino-acid N-acetyltransferase
MSRDALPLPAGYLAAGVHAGLKADGALDLALICSRRPAAAAGRVTTNAVKAAPARHTEAVLRSGRPVRAVVVNTKFANALTGHRGRRDLARTLRETARRLRVRDAEVISHSTGVIGVPLPMPKILRGIREAAARLSTAGGLDAATAIRTTDNVTKTSTRTLTVEGLPVRVTGMAKGAGMIHPNMATMLAYLFTDAAVPAGLLDRILGEAVDRSFHCITVDGDTSTNDSVLLLANGAYGGPPLRAGSAAARAFAGAVNAVCLDLAQAIVRDGEGATKFVTIRIRGARTDADARRASMAVARSPLVKTAVFGADPNWGRIMCAVGYSGARVDEFRAAVTIGGYRLYDRGRPVAWSKDRLKDILSGREVEIEVDLGLGRGAATAYTCDLTHGYVAFNGMYTT